MIEWFDRAGREITMEQAERLMADPDYRVVAQERVKVRRREFLVSTIWLGLDHSFMPGSPREVFETLVFPDHTYMRRYATEEEAMQGHREAIALLHLDAQMGKVRRRGKP